MLMDTQADLARDILGQCGRMISASKSEYRSKHLGSIVVFNANVCTGSQGKIWFGDIDVSAAMDKLELLADAIGETIYVLYEMDARFENEYSPRLDRAVWQSS